MMMQVWYKFTKIGQKVLKLWCKTLFADRMTEFWNYEISDTLKTVYSPKTPFCVGYKKFEILFFQLKHCQNYIGA